MSWLKLANTNCGSLSLTPPTPPPPLSITPPTPPPTLRPLRPLVIDMMPVTTEDTMPSPVDPGEAAAEDEDVGDEAEVEEDITLYADTPTLGSTDATHSFFARRFPRPRRRRQSISLWGIARIFTSSECPVAVYQSLTVRDLGLIRCSASVFECVHSVVRVRSRRWPSQPACPSQSRRPSAHCAALCVMLHKVTRFLARK